MNPLRNHLFAMTGTLFREENRVLFIFSAH